MYRLLLILFTVAVSTQRAEEQHSVVTALQSTTLSGYVDTSASWWTGSRAAIPPGQTILLTAGTASFTEKLTDSVVVSDGFPEVRTVVSGTVNISMTVPGLENVTFTPETSISAGIGNLQLGGTISEGVLSGNSVTFSFYDDSVEPPKKLGQATFTKAGNILKLTASASNLNGGSIVTDTLSPDLGTESGEAMFMVQVNDLAPVGGRVHFKATKTVTTRTIDGEPTQLRSISVNGQRDTTKPTLTIVSPKNNARVQSPDVLLRGTVKDNFGVPIVQVNLNSNEQWTQAEGGTTWSNLLHLVPGPNLLRVVATDAEGNHSIVPAFFLTYVKTQQFNVNIVGRGSVSPNLNGKFLEVAKNYSVTAVPAPGFRFLNWSGGLEGTTAKKTFSMPDALLSATATFVDSAAPSVVITSPKANARVLTEQVPIAGTAKDNVAVAKVMLNLDGTGWFEAQGTTNWIAGEPIALGSHTLQVYSEDAAGNRSKTNRVVFRAPDYRGIYFGSYSEPQGRGLVGVLVTSDQKLVVITGDTTSNFDSATKIDYMEIARDGKFDQTIEGERTFGTFTDTGFSGKFITTDNATGTFSGAKKPATGVQADHAGYYVGTYQMPGETGEVRGILAADGKMLITVLSEPLPGENGERAGGAGTGTINASGVLTATVGGAPIRGNLVGYVISGTFRAEAGEGTFEMTQVATPGRTRNMTVVGGNEQNGGIGIVIEGPGGGGGPPPPPLAFQSADEIQRESDGKKKEDIVAAVTGPISPNTLAPSVLEVNGAGDDGFGFLFSTEVGHKYRVEGSYDFVNWSVLLPAFTATAEEYQFVDPELGDAHRFYRVVAE